MRTQLAGVLGQVGAGRDRPVGGGGARGSHASRIGTPCDRRHVQQAATLASPDGEVLGGAHDPDTRRPSRPVVGLRPRGGVVPRLRGRAARPATSAPPPRCSPPQSFWRDLVSFTWNLTTVENPPGVAGLLEANLERVDPSGFALTEPADEAGGVVTAWFAFETSTGRGSGLLRLKEEDRRGQGLDLPHHAARAQGSRGAARHAPADGRRARREQGPADVEGEAAGGGREPRQHDAAVRAGHRRRPGRHRAWARGCASSACRPSSSTSTRGPATSGATGTSRSACTTRSGTTTCRT